MPPIEPLEVPLVLPELVVEPVVLSLLWLALVVSRLLLCVVVSVFGEVLFFFMSPSAIAEPLASATIELKMNAGASLRIWASLSIKGLVEHGENLQTARCKRRAIP